MSDIFDIIISSASKEEMAKLLRETEKLRQEQVAKNESMRAFVLALKTEVNCRTEHGANSNGHLEYVEDQLNKILEATL